MSGGEAAFYKCAELIYAHLFLKGKKSEAVYSEYKRTASFVLPCMEKPMKTKCISEEALDDFLSGRLNADRCRSIESHLADCDDCLEMVTLSNGVVRGGDPSGTEPVPAAVTRSAVRLALQRQEENRRTFSDRIRRFKNSLRSRLAEAVVPIFLGSPASAPIRGSKEQVADDLVRLQKTFPHLDTEIEIEKIRQDLANIRVRLAGVHRKERGVRVGLERDGREISSQLIGGRYALFEDISFGRYCLRFTRDGKNFGEYFFELKESLNDG